MTYAPSLALIALGAIALGYGHAQVAVPCAILGLLFAIMAMGTGSDGGRSL